MCPAGNVMHLVSSGGHHHIISQAAQVTVQSPAPTAHRLTPSASSQGVSLRLCSAGVLKLFAPVTLAGENLFIMDLPF